MEPYYSGGNINSHQNSSSHYHNQDGSGMNIDDEGDIASHDRRSLHELQKQPLQPKVAAVPSRAMRQKKFIQQRSILKNSQERSTMTTEDLELLEAKKQLILRRRRLFSHYRQYEQWRRRQFSYDPSYYYRANPTAPPLGQAACSDYGSSGGGGGGVVGGGAGAFRRRRQYRRQYSCAERSREDSRESRESTSQQQRHQHHHHHHHYQQQPTLMASDTIQTDSSTLNHSTTYQTERISFDSSECGALAYQPLHCNSTSRHFHMLQEEHSTAISERCTRSRINSAIFVSSEGKGFDSIEFLRRHGSQSVLCRKARSAENITDNGRKKSFSDKRQWRTDEGADASVDTDADVSKDCTAIELQECHQRPSTLSVLQANIYDPSAPLNVTTVLGHTAAVTTANMVVGSISIEAPPSHLKDDAPIAERPLQYFGSRAATESASHSDSTDTVEELILVPTTTTTAAAATTEIRSRVLVHQRSSISSANPPTRSQSQSPALSLRGIKPKIAALPMVSVSGPSPPHEKPPPPAPSERL